MKNAFIAAAMTTVLLAPMASANEEMNSPKKLGVKMTTGQTSLAWNIEHTGCTKDRHLMTMVSYGDMIIDDPTTLVQEKVKKVPEIFARTMKEAIKDWLALDLSTAKEIATEQTNIPREQSRDRMNRFINAGTEFQKAVQEELGIKITGHSISFDVDYVSPAPSLACQ